MASETPLSHTEFLIDNGFPVTAATCVYPCICIYVSMSGIYVCTCVYYRTVPWSLFRNLRKPPCQLAPPGKGQRLHLNGKLRNHGRGCDTPGFDRVGVRPSASGFEKPRDLSGLVRVAPQSSGTLERSGSVRAFLKTLGLRLRRLRHSGARDNETLRSPKLATGRFP